MRFRQLIFSITQTLPLCFIHCSCSLSSCSERSTHADNHAGGEVIAASHSIETRSSIGTHTGKLALLRKYARTEACQNLAVVNTSLGACNNLFDKSLRPWWIAYSTSGTEGNIIFFSAYRYLIHSLLK